MALSEARLEGGMAQNDIYDKLYTDHYLLNGEPPSDEQQQMMLQAAKEGSMAAVNWNSALIYFSNKLVIPNIVGPRGGVRNFLKSQTEDILNLKDGFIRKTSKETVLKSGKKVYLPEYSYVQNNFRNMLTSFYKDPLRKSVKGGLTYFKANIAEGIQENAQEVIAEATKNYYIDRYKDPAKVNALGTFEYAKRLTKDAIQEQFTGQGFETFASGFVMGMFSAPLNAIPRVASIGYNKLFDREQYEEYRTLRENYGKNLAKNLNSVSITDFFDSRMMNYGTQIEATDLGSNGTEKESKDASNAALIGQLTPMLKHGTLENFKDYLKAFKDLTPEEFEEVVNAEPGTGGKYLGKIDEVLGKVDRIKKRYDYYTEKFPNPISYNQLKELEGTPDYADAAYLYNAWEAGVNNAIYFNESFEDVSERMTSIINSVVANSPLQKATATDVKVLFDDELLSTELGILDSEVKSLKESTLPTAKKDLEKKQKRLDALTKLQAFTEGYREFINNRKKLENDLREKGISQEDIDEAVIDAYGKFGKGLREGFFDYFRSIGELTDDFIFDQTLDDALEKYIDFHLLDSEKRAMVQAVNVLNDPQGFLDHIQRNQVWMKELYENKAEYYEDMKNKAFEVLEGNALLNELANRGIYISLDDYQRWKDDRVLPEEFYDDLNKVVIRPGNPKYDELANLFQIIDFKDQTGAYDPIVKQKLADLDKQMENEIDKLPKSENRKELGEIPKGRSKYLTVDKINKNLSDGEYAEAFYHPGKDTKLEEESLIFYKDGEVLRFNGVDGEEVDIKNFKSLSDTGDLFNSANKYTITMSPDPVEVDRIKAEYAKRREEIIEDYIAEGKQAAEPIEAKPLSTESSLDEIAAESAELYNSLVMAFEDYIEKAGITDLDVDDYNEALASFVKTNLTASQIISDYVKNKELAEGTEADPSDRVPILNLGDRQVKISDLTEPQLRNYLRTFESGLKVLEKKENPTDEDLDKIRNYKYSIRVIEDYLGKTKKQQYTPAQVKTLEKVQKVIDAQDDLLKTKNGYVVNGKLLSRVTNVIKQFESEEYRYAAEDAILAAYRTTIESTGLNKDSIDEFISQIKKQSLPGFSEFTYNELDRELKSLTERDLADSEVNLEEFILKIVLEKTYEASRIAGNYIDEQLRNIFDNKPAIYDESKISREAYDNLFSTDPENLGYVTQIKNIIDEKNMIVISKVTPKNAEERGLVVFDEEAGVAGEIDLLVIDAQGNLMVLDVKTGKSTKWKGFEKEGNIASKKLNYTLQQGTYANLLYNLTGEQAKIALLPIEVDYEEETGKIIKGKGRPSAKGLIPDNDFRIMLEITPEIQAQLDIMVPRKVFEPVLVEEGPTSSEDGETSMYEEVDYEGAPDAPEFVGVDPKILMLISNATQEQLDNVKKALAEKIGIYDVAELIEIQEAIDKRQRELESSSSVVKYTPSNIGKGTSFIAESATFTDKKGKELFADTGDVVIVSKVNAADNTLTLQNINGKTKTLSFDQLNKLFKLKDTVMDFEEVSVEDAPLTKEEKDFIAESSENVREFLKDLEAKDTLKKEADSQSLDEVDDELFNDTTSDC
jgi:hypothetical protein